MPFTAYSPLPPVCPPPPGSVPVRSVLALTPPVRNDRLMAAHHQWPDLRGCQLDWHPTVDIGSAASKASPTGRRGHGPVADSLAGRRGHGPVADPQLPLLKQSARSRDFSRSSFLSPAGDLPLCGRASITPDRIETSCTRVRFLPM